MNKDERNIFKSTIEEIQSLLTFLEKEFGIDFVLSLVSKKGIGEQKEIKNLYISKNPSQESSNFIVSELNAIILRKYWINKLLSEGIHLVECVDNSGKPDNVPNENWIVIGEIYFVADILCNYKGYQETYYRLKDKDGKSSPFLILNKKFRKLILEEIWN